MTSYEKLAKLRQWVARNELAQARARQRLVEQLGKTVLALRDADQDIKQLSDLAKGKSACLALAASPELRTCLEEIKGNVAELRAQLQEDGSAVGLGLWNTNGQKTLRLKARRIVELAKIAWETDIQNEFGKHFTLGNLLSKVPATTEAGRTLKAEAIAGLELKRPFPPDSRHIVGREKIAKRANDLASNLAATGLTLKVQEFLKAAVTGSATIEQCTEPEVLEWVAKAGAARSFKVSIT